MVLQACMKVVENTNIFQDCRLLGSEYVKDASSETSAHTYRTAWLYILGANLHSTRRGSLKTQQKNSIYPDSFGSLQLSCYRHSGVTVTCAILPTSLEHADVFA